MPKCDTVVLITSFEAGFSGPIKRMGTLYSIHNAHNIPAKWVVFTNCQDAFPFTVTVSKAEH